VKNLSKLITSRKPTLLKSSFFESVGLKTITKKDLASKLYSSDVRVESLESQSYIQIEKKDTLSYLKDSFSGNNIKKFFVRDIHNAYPDIVSTTQAISMKEDVFLGALVFIDTTAPENFSAQVISTDTFIQDITGGGKWVFPLIDGEYISDHSRYHSIKQRVNSSISNFETTEIITKENEGIFLPAGVVVFQTKSSNNLCAHLFYYESIVTHSELVDYIGSQLFQKEKSRKYEKIDMATAMHEFGDMDIDIPSLKESLSLHYARLKLLKLKYSNR